MFESDQHVSDQHDTKVSARNPELCRVPAANRRRNECSADFPAAKLFLNRKAFHAYAQEVNNSQLLYASDTRDCGKFFSEVRENLSKWPWD
jgi:hypothetical protein